MPAATPRTAAAQDKQAARKQRNRESAAQSRERAREYTKVLETRSAAAEAELHMMRLAVRRLEREAGFLRQRLATASGMTPDAVAGLVRDWVASLPADELPAVAPAAASAAGAMRPSEGGYDCTPAYDVPPPGATLLFDAAFDDAASMRSSPASDASDAAASVSVATLSGTASPVAGHKRRRQRSTSLSSADSDLTLLTSAPPPPPLPLPHPPTADVATTPDAAATSLPSSFAPTPPPPHGAARASAFFPLAPRTAVDRTTDESAALVLIHFAAAAALPPRHTHDTALPAAPAAAAAMPAHGAHDLLQEQQRSASLLPLKPHAVLPVCC